MGTYFKMNSFNKARAEMVRFIEGILGGFSSDVMIEPIFLII